jgi:O-antigen/teichoic acid export membrane protein
VEIKVLSRLLKGLSANVYGQVVAVIVQVVGVPILLHAWGARLYGEWLVLFAITAYVSLSDFGFLQSAANDMTQHESRGDRADALAVFQSSCALVCGGATGGFALMTALLFGLPLADWLKLSTISLGEARWTLWFLAAEGLARLADGLSHAGFRAGNDYSFHVYVSSSLLLLQFVAIWIAALLGAGPVLAAASFFGVRVLAVPLISLLLIRRHSWLRFGFAKAKLTELRRLAKPALANLSLPLAQAINIQGLVLVVGALQGPLAVVTFSTLRTLTRLALQPALVVNHAAEPELAAAYGTRNQPLMLSIFLHALRSSLWLAIAAAAALAFFGAFLLHAWTHGKVRMDPPLFFWLLASAVAGTLWYNGLIVLKAANRHLGAAFLYSLCATAAVVVSAALLGVPGRLANAGLGLFIMDAVMSIYTLRAASRIVSVPLSVCLAQAINPYPIVRLAMSKAHVG